MSEKVVSTVAERTDTDPLSLEPLHAVIDPDALNALFGGDRTAFDQSPDRVEFTYCGFDVVVTGDGDVRVSRSAEHEPANDLDIDVIEH